MANENKKTDDGLDNKPLNQNGFGASKFINRNRNPLKKNDGILRKANGTPINQRNNSVRNNNAENEENKSSIESASEKVAEKAGSAAIQAATGGAIPKPVADMISKKFAGPVAKRIRRKMRIYLILAAVPIIFLLLLLLVMAGDNDDVENSKTQYFNTNEMSDEDFNKYLENMGYCSVSEKTCDSSDAKKFYKTLKTNLSKISSSSRASAANVALSILGYNRSDEDMFKISDEEIAFVTDSLSKINYTSSTDLSKSDDFKGSIKEYIKKYRSDLTDSDNTMIDRIISNANDANERTKEYTYKPSNSGSTPGGNTLAYEECKSVKAYDSEYTKQNIELDLEEAVVRVVDHEGGQFDDPDFGVSNYAQLWKELAVMARTELVRRSDNCKNSVFLSGTTIAMLPPSNSRSHHDKVKEAVQDTKGEVLTINGHYVMASWDNMYNYDCTRDDKYCYGGPYYKVGELWGQGEQHEVRAYKKWAWRFGSGSHGNGTSLYAALTLADEGYDYKQLLKYFYADGAEITKLTPIASTFVKRVERPQRDNTFYYTADGNAGAAGTLEGECAWYGTVRAKEILATIGSNKTWTYNGNGGTYCDDDSDAKKFTMSTDYTKPKPGSLVVWVDTNNVLKGAYGHVAVIEEVNGDKVVTSEAAVNKGILGSKYIWEVDGSSSARKRNCEGNNSGCFYTDTLSISQIQHRYGYTFKCYVYLVE